MSNVPLEDHKQAVAESWRRFMNGNFDPWSLPAHIPRSEDRMAAAMEYAAYQLGEINHKLTVLIELTARRG